MSEPSHEGKAESARIGRVFRTLAEEHLAERRRDDGREVWRRIEEAGRRRARRRFEVRLWVPALALALGAGLLGLGLGTDELRDRRLRFVVEGGTAPALDLEQQRSLEGTLIATEEGDARLSFSDESSFLLRPRTTLRVHIDASERVVARLTQGTLRVRVRHRDETDYRFRAGEFEVRVVGTAFELGYEPTAKKLSLAMEEGRVVVALPGGGERSFAAGEKAELLEAAQSAGAPSPPAEEPPRSSEGNEPPEASAERPRPDPSSERVRGAVDLRRLAKDGKFSEIVALVDKDGGASLDGRPAAELHEIGQAARYTGRADLAERAFTLLVTRHAATEQGRGATFFLGRLAEERGRLGVALGWYERCWTGKSAKFAEEALGRSLVLTRQSRGVAAAQKLAERYLNAHPNGPYRATAERILKEDRERPEGAQLRK